MTSVNSHVVFLLCSLNHFTVEGSILCKLAKETSFCYGQPRFPLLTSSALSSDVDEVDAAC